MGEMLDLTPEKLNNREIQLIEIEMRRGQLVDTTLPKHREALDAEWGHEMRRLLAAWQKLPADGQSFLTRTLSDQIQYSDYTAIDIGSAIQDSLALIRGRRTANVPGLYEVVQALYSVWIGRDRPPTIRNLSRDLAEGRKPSDLHIFIAKHLISIFGKEAFSRSVDTQQVIKTACTAADSALTRR